MALKETISEVNALVGSLNATGSMEGAIIGAKGDKGDKGDTGDTGNGIQSVTKTSTSGLVDTYTILYTDGTTSTFAVTNGADGTDGIDGRNGIDGRDGVDGHSPTITTSRVGNTVTILSDGESIGTVQDGADGHTPVKGTDYFTTAEIQQIQNEVSSGAIGDFKSVVDTETDKFNANATEKVNTYNQNDSEKTASYNANATKKLNAYNANANNRVAEFDAHTEQIQTDIGELKSDLIDLYAMYCDEYYEKKPLFKETGVCIGTDGTKSEKTDFVICKYEVTEDSVLKLNLSKDNETGAVYQFMNSSKVSYASNSNVVGNTVTNGTNDFVTVPKGATYLMVSMASTNTTNKVYATRSILDTDDNMFCEEFANNTLSQLKKSSSGHDYISDTNKTFGYKDIEHGYFVFGSTGYNVGIIDGLPLPLNVGNYKLSAKVCIPSGNGAVSKLYFGAYTFPDGSIPFKQLDLVDIENLDTWVTIEKIITIDETHTHVYIGGRGYGNFPIYMKNIRLEFIKNSFQNMPLLETHQTKKKKKNDFL